MTERQRGHLSVVVRGCLLLSALCLVMGPLTLAGVCILRGSPWHAGLTVFLGAVFYALCFGSWLPWHPSPARKETR